MRVAAAVADRHADGAHLADAVIDAIVDQYAAQDESGRDAILLVTTHPALRETFVHTATAIEFPLAEAIARYLGATGAHTARILAAAVTAAVRIALEQWLRPVPMASGLVVPTGALPDLLRAALAPLVPALDAAENHTSS